MRRVAPQLSAFVLALIACARVSAHDGPPVAFAVLTHDAEGARAVSLSAGVALRRAAQRYQFVCPGAWRDQFSAPLAALPDGTIVVGTTHGLMLLDDAGTLRPHPDPAASGPSSELVRSDSGVFSLRPVQSGSEVLAIADETVRVLWQDTTSWSTLAALDGRLVLMRGVNRLLELVTISAADGSELERQSAALDLPVDYVYARGSYVLLVYRNGTMALGSVAMSTFTKLAEGALSIAGPLTVDNATLLALDGNLILLAGGALLPVADDREIACLTEQDGLVYACERYGISHIERHTLAEPLFRFDWLEAPALERVPEGEPRMLCNAQWQDFVLDMQQALPELTLAAPRDMQLPAAAGGNAEPPVPKPAARCSTAPAARAAPTRLVGCALVLLGVWCRRRRRWCIPRMRTRA